MLPAWLLIGPTACGKNAAGVELALELGAEVVSLDSMKVFRGMDIGTAKPTPAMRARVPHHLLDLVDPSEPFDVAHYLAAVDQALADLDRRGVPALFAGGTLLHLQALLRGLCSGPPADPALRAVLRARPETLHARLQQVDPESAARLHPHDVRRLVRALEVFELTGEPLSLLQRRDTRPHLDRPVRGLILARERDVLYGRIDRRCVEMFDAGWVEETLAIRKGGGFGPQAGAALGYREILAALERGDDPRGCLTAIQHATHRLARKQATWLARFSPLLETLAIEPGWGREQAIEAVLGRARKLVDEPPLVLEGGSWLRGKGS